MRIFETLSAILASATLAACTLLTGPDGRRMVGIVQWTTPSLSLAPQSYSGVVYSANPPSDPVAQPVLEAPDMVMAGTPFDVVVRTYGADGCWSEAGAETSTTGLTIAITPYDRHEVRTGYSCTMAVVRLPRTLRVSFSQPGLGVIRVTGRKILNGSDSGSREEFLTVEKQVIVR